MFSMRRRHHCESESIMVSQIRKIKLPILYKPVNIYRETDSVTAPQGISSLEERPSNNVNDWVTQTSESLVEVPVGFLDITSAQQLAVGTAQLTVMIERLFTYNIGTAWTNVSERLITSDLCCK